MHDQPLILLIHPPVAKPCEPPAGIARLSGLLENCGVAHRLFDANIEGLLYLMGQPPVAEKTDDAWTRRAFQNRDRNISSLQDLGLYGNLDRYKRAVKDLSRVLAGITPPDVTIGLANYEHREMSPLRSGDLLAAAKRPELNPFYPFFRARLHDLFGRKEPSMVGVSLNYLSQALCAFAMIGFIRREFPGVKVIMGGGLVTSWLKNPDWRNPFSGLVDHFVAGPGEYHLLRLLGREGMEGTLPRPNYRHLLPGRYLSPGFVLPYSASSGCYWNRCSFCPEKAEENRYVPVPVKQALSELKELAGQNDPVLLHLLDNAISPALLDALSGNDLGVPWYGFARVDRTLGDPEFCMALKEAGCVMLKLGIESGDQQVLDALEKGIRVEEASIVLRNLKRAGIAAYVYLLFGTPAETESSARKTLEFTLRHCDCVDFLNIAIFNMPICGATASGIEIKGFSEGDLSLYTDFVHPSGWDRRRVRQFLDGEFKTHPGISPILRNDPPVFTSNHAPFFVMRRQGQHRGVSKKGRLHIPPDCV